MRSALTILVLLGAASACGGGPKPNPRDVADANDTGRTLAPRGPNEQTILQQLGQLPPGAPRRFGDVTVVAEQPYQAASGRSCRALRLVHDKQGQATHRLACTSGRTWFFVPDVLGLQEPPK